MSTTKPLSTTSAHTAERLDPDTVMVADELRCQGLPSVPCPAAILLDGEIRRRGARTVRGPLRTGPQRAALGSAAFLGLDLAHCAAMIHADAGFDQLCLSSDWLAWGTYGDDYFPVVFGAARDLPAAKLCNERLSSFMPLDLGATPEPVNQIERGLADLWLRTAGPMSPTARTTFRRAVEDMTFSWVWELENQAYHRVPDPVDYLEMRRSTFGSDMTRSLAKLASFPDVDPALFQNRTIRELETAAQDYACFTNDLFSYQKEIEFEGEVHNLVLIVEHFFDVDLHTARDIVADLMRARMEQFEHILANDLPKLLADFDLDEATSRALLRDTENMKEWMSGILEWHRRFGVAPQVCPLHRGGAASTAHPEERARPRAARPRVGTDRPRYFGGPPEHSAEGALTGGRKRGGFGFVGGTGAMVQAVAGHEPEPLIPCDRGFPLCPRGTRTIPLQDPSPLVLSADLSLDGRCPTMDSSRWSRWTTIAAVLMPAVIAAVVSYSQSRETGAGGPTGVGPPAHAGP